MKRLLIKGIKWMSYGLYLLLAIWALLELAFRYQWIDFYAAELHGLNPDSVLHARPEKRRMLLLGDSFSAQPESYVKTLRDSLPAWDVINAAVPGTGIREAAVIAADKTEKFPPDILLYQIYVGNDLWDIRKSYDSPQISLPRKIYWFLSDYSLSLRYLNYKAGQLKHRTGVAIETRELKQDMPFSPAQYSRREQLLFQADPGLIRNSILAGGGREKDLKVWLEKMDALLAGLPERTKSVVLLVVPHCAQVNDFYRQNLEALGAATAGTETAQSNYPFLRQITEHYAGDSRVKICSPLPWFQQNDAPGSRLYYENDPHLNGRGHKVLGRMMATSLSE